MVTFRAVDLQIATFVTVYISSGQCAAIEVLPNGQKGLEVPFFMFGGLDEFCQEQWELPWEQVEARIIANRSDEACTAFESFIYGNVEDRALFEELLAALPDDEARRERLTQWNEERRSSINDIAGRALQLAEAVRKIKAEEENRVVEPAKTH